MGKAQAKNPRWEVALYPLLWFIILAVLGVQEAYSAGSSTVATIPATAPDRGYGANPELPAPERSIIPIVSTARAIGWQDGKKPAVAPGFKVEAYATGLSHPRWIYVLPNGDVLVAETNAPAKPGSIKGVKGFFAKREMKKAGAAAESANRITLLRGVDENGRAKMRGIFLGGLNSPFGMALTGNDFYVANTDSVMRFNYNDGDTSITEKAVKVADLPAGPINHHWTKNIIASPDGRLLYVTVGSNSNIGESGMDAENMRAAILEINPETRELRVFASGLRNPVGLGWQPESGRLWTVVNERDELGNNLVPDYMTSVRDGGFYGWPYSYFGQNIDPRVKPQNPAMVAKAIAPDYALGSHTASLGFAFYNDALFPAHYRGGAFIGQHGSWNRKPKSGYKVVFIPFAGGNPAGMPEDFLTGFLDEDENARGRPVGVAVDKQGALLVADDVGNIIWRVTPSL